MMAILPKIILFSSAVQALSGTADSNSAPRKILVTGAAGRTGQLVFQALQTDPLFDPKALVRSEKSGMKIRKAVKNTQLDQIIVCDVTNLSDSSSDGIVESLQDLDSMVVCTSAVPTISKVSLVKQLLKVPINLVRGKRAVDFRSMKFVWKHDGYPEKVDFAGQKAQIDLAKKIGVNSVVVVSSMGGTDKDNFLNSVGKSVDGSGNGDILLWKRKAERYLVDSGLDYTIIHPGGLVDKPAGLENYVLDVDDKLMSNKNRSICRADVANLCVAALKVCKGKKVALDCITKVIDDQSTPESPEDVLKAFLAGGKDYNYDL